MLRAFWSLELVLGAFCDARRVSRLLPILSVSTGFVATLCRRVLGRSLGSQRMAEMDLGR